MPHGFATNLLHVFFWVTDSKERHVPQLCSSAKGYRCLLCFFVFNLRFYFRYHMLSNSRACSRSTCFPERENNKLCRARQRAGGRPSHPKKHKTAKQTNKHAKRRRKRETTVKVKLMRAHETCPKDGCEFEINHRTHLAHRYPRMNCKSDFKRFHPFLQQHTPGINGLG